MEIAIALVLFAILFVIWLAIPKREKVCIVSLVKEPHQFQTWIDYHKNIDKFYIFQDDDDEDFGVRDDRLILVKNWKDKLGFKWDDTKDEPINRNRKQRFAFEAGHRMAMQDDIKYIIHIDSDELLYGQDPSKVFSKYPEATVFHIQNEELAPTCHNYTNCFREGTRFHSDPDRFIGYGNGKAAGVVGKCRWYGPHYFRGGPSIDIPNEELVVLHYPACNLEETIKRSRQYGNFRDESGIWTDHHKETRDLLVECDGDCEERALFQFKKRMADDSSKKINVM